jgi:hypothetical protein
MNPHANHFVYLLPPEGVRAFLEAARRKGAV